MEIVLKTRLLPLFATSNKNDVIYRMIDIDTLRLIITDENCKYFLLNKSMLGQEPGHKDRTLLYCDNLEENSILRLIQYNRQGILSKKDNIIIYHMDISTLSELKRCLLNTKYNIIEIMDCDTRYDKSSKYSYLVEMCESLNKFKMLVYIV